MRPTVRRLRTLRSVTRLTALAWPWKRKQIIERFLRVAFGDVVEGCGHLMEVDPADRLLGARLRRRGVWSEAETALYHRCIRPGDTVVDCGANIGYFTLMFARLVGSTGRVIAFEPEPRNRNLLERNVARNGYENVTTEAFALSRNEGRAVLSLSRDNLGDHRLGVVDERRTVDVPVTTLDAYLVERRRPIDFIKLDVQGAEAAVWDGARETLAGDRRMSMLTEFWPTAIEDAGDEPGLFLERIAGAGFSIAVLSDAGPVEPLPAPADRAALCSEATDVNLFCWRGKSPLED